MNGPSLHAVSSNLAWSFRGRAKHISLPLMYDCKISTNLLRLL